MVNPLSQFGLTDLELNAAMARDPKVIAALEHKASDVEQCWKSIAPVFGETGVDERRQAPPHDEPGAYRDSIRTELIRGKDGLPAARVGTDDYKAIWIELGSRHMPEYAPAQKTATMFHDTTGPRFTEETQQAQQHLRRQVETLAKMRAEGAAAHMIAAQQKSVAAARQARSAAFRAARPRRGRRR